MDLRQTFFNKIVKTAFYVSRERFCRKKLIHQFQILREIFRDVWQETRLTLSSIQNCTQCVEREFDRKFLGFFFSFSAGSTNWTLPLLRNFSRKNTFHEDNIYFYRFRTLIELYLRVQRNVLFRNTVLEFFSSGHDFKPKVFGFGRISLNFFSKPPSTSPQELLEGVYFAGKTTHLFIILKFWANTFGCLVKSFQQNCPTCNLRVKKKHLEREIYAKKTFSSSFLDFDQKTCELCQYLFASLNKTASTCP